MARLTERTLPVFLDGLKPASDFGVDVREIGYGLGLVDVEGNEKSIRALAACRQGIPPESVSRLLDWKAFEKLCSDLLRAYGYLVTENIHLTKPRAQIDIYARSHMIALAVDCKHRSRPAGPSSVSVWVDAQVLRAERLRAWRRDSPPIASAILVLNDGQVRFVNGGAVVPIFALRSFAESVLEYSGFLRLV